jgi:hypothetical protein
VAPFGHFGFQYRLQAFLVTGIAAFQQGTCQRKIRYVWIALQIVEYRTMSNAVAV